MSAVKPFSLGPTTSLAEMLAHALSCGASDIHLGEGVAPMMRVDGDLLKIAEELMNGETLLRLIGEYLPQDRVKEFEAERELDWSFGVKDLGRFRVNLYFQRNMMGAAIRALPFAPRS